MFKKMSVGKRIYAGFGVVLVLLAVVGVYSTHGIGGITGNIGVMADGRDLRAEMVQKEVDHLNGAGAISHVPPPRNEGNDFWKLADAS